MPRLAWLPMVFAWLVAAPADAQVKPLKGWQQMRSANFYLIGDVGEGDLRRVAGRLEQFRAAVGVILPKATLTAATRTTVMVFRSHRNYEPFKPVYNGKTAEHIAGYFLPGESANLITLTIETRGDGGDDERFGIIYHELVHLMVNSTVRGLPLWFNEGLARILSDAGSDRRRPAGVVVGRIHAPHVLLLRERFLPVLISSWPSITAHRSTTRARRSSIFYAESWALVHYLLLGQKQKYASKASLLLDAVEQRNASFADACQLRPGDLRWRSCRRSCASYVERESFTSIQWAFAERLAAVERLTSHAVERCRRTRRRRCAAAAMGREEEARAHLDLAVSINPMNSQAHSSLWHAVRAAEPAVNLRARTCSRLPAEPVPLAQTHFDLATTLQRIQTSKSDSDVDARIEASLRQAISLDPAFAGAYMALARLLDQRPGDGREIFALQQKAIALAPGREDYMLNLGYSLANRQQLADARTVLTALASGAADEHVRAGAADLMKQLFGGERPGATREVAVNHAADGPRVTRLALRPVAAGEAQLQGTVAGDRVPPWADSPGRRRRRRPVVAGPRESVRPHRVHHLPGDPRRDHLVRG